MTGAGKRAPFLAVLIALLAGSSLEGRQSRGASALRATQGDGQQPNVSEPAQVEPSAAQNYLEKQVPPKYPEKARQMRVQGTVVLNVMISKKGKVTEISVISGHPLLVPAAIDAVKQWRYKPYRVAGHKVEAQTEVVVNFEFEK
jgi:TonB family protein